MRKPNVDSHTTVTNVPRPTRGNPNPPSDDPRELGQGRLMSRVEDGNAVVEVREVRRPAAAGASPQPAAAGDIADDRPLRNVSNNALEARAKRLEETLDLGPDEDVASDVEMELEHVERELEARRVDAEIERRRVAEAAAMAAGALVGGALGRPGGTLGTPASERLMRAKERIAEKREALLDEARASQAEAMESLQEIRERIGMVELSLAELVASTTLLVEQVSAMRATIVASAEDTKPD